MEPETEGLTYVQPDEISAKTSKKQGNGVLKFAVKILRFISLGQYPTKLYHKGRDVYSTAFGGIVTIICFLILFGYGYYLIYSLTTRQVEYLETNMYTLDRLLDGLYE